MHRFISPDTGLNWPHLAQVRPERLALEVWSTGLQAAWLAAESHSVISHRLLGFSGLAPRGQDEVQRMFLEKSTAFSAAAIAGAMLALSGRRPDEIWRAMMHPLRHTTGRNLRRLERIRKEHGGKRRAARARLSAGLARQANPATA
ncbi:hypothetical protein [Vannielia litorea]|uniref:Uncharacterized protein n=1 Tax=Vannielia litorea TaxID=1217970 RepID=A0A1N6FHZ5_9RHOB|nr:hypothetical protein [Vannielia litorea]SIN94903.1 hypothetical protein SAMN05444002_1687 [Vannielia litorea]